VRIVENPTPLWADASDAWVVGPDPEIEIRSDFGMSDHYLFRSRYVRRLGDGSIVVGNQGTQELFFFDPLGRFLRAAGRPGDGPGEFQGISGLFQCDEETLVVLERSRLSVWNLEGQFLESVSLLQAGMQRGRRVDSVGPGCGAGLFLENVGRPSQYAPGIYDASVVLYRSTFEGTLRDTIATVVADQAFLWEAGGELLDMYLPFAERASWVTAGEEVIIGRGIRFELEVLGPRGDLRQLVRWGAQRSPVTDRDRDNYSTWRRDLIERAPEEQRYYPPIDRIPLPSEKPTHERILADGAGSVWVQQSGSWWTDPSDEWWVFDSTGRWLGAVTMPTGLSVLAIDGEYVIGVFYDEYDVEHVRLHRISKPA